MSRLVARILLSLLVFPLALVCFFAATLTMFEINRARDEDAVFFVSTLAALGLTFIYWTLLWRKSVRWTPKRQFAPYGIAVLCVVIATVATGAMARHIEWPPFFMLTGLAAMIAWLMATIFLWQETPLERGE
jgi:hypothetical protein